MGIPKYIWIKNKRYYLYDTYTTYKKAREIAEKKKKKSKKNKWFILPTKTEGITGMIYAHKQYNLYMTHIIKINAI